MIAPRSRMLNLIGCEWPSPGLAKQLPYGELCFVFLLDIFKKVNANSRTVLVDLGSGIRSVYHTFALLTGGHSFGVEFRSELPHLRNSLLIH
jgi:hypothetical protein